MAIEIGGKFYPDDALLRHMSDVLLEHVDAALPPGADPRTLIRTIRATKSEAMYRRALREGIARVIARETPLPAVAEADIVARFPCVTV